jgi:hypothetical protein
VALQRIGLVLVARGDLMGALASYREEFDVVSALAAKDPGNAQFQGDVTVSVNFIGNVLLAQGGFGSALAAYRKGLDLVAHARRQGPGQRAVAARRGGEPR